MLYKGERMFYNGKRMGGDANAGKALFLRVYRPSAGKTALGGK